jgi:hypothetical protein
MPQIRFIPDEQSVEVRAGTSVLRAAIAAGRPQAPDVGRSFRVPLPGKAGHYVLTEVVGWQGSVGGAAPGPSLHRPRRDHEWHVPMVAVALLVAALVAIVVLLVLVR